MSTKSRPDLELPPGSRVPLPVGQLISRIGLPESGATAATILSHVTVDAPILEDYRPLAESLECRLAELHWATAGVLPFADHEVPYIINNTGRLSVHAAIVLFEHLEDVRPQGRIAVLELGAGTGLFARYFIDAFSEICREQGRDYHERLTFVASDFSERTVEQWRERGIFANDGERVVLVRCHALQPSLPPGIGDLHAVFCNYVLDILPASVVKRDGDVCSELHVRTRLTPDKALLRAHTRLEAAEIQALASAGEARLAELIPLVSLFDQESKFLPAGPGPLQAADAIRDFAGELDTVVVNHGALNSLQRLADLLHPDGFILVNDYGPVRIEQMREQSFPQRFGPTVAFGLHFPFLTHALKRAGLVVMEPPGDAEAAVHARLIQKRERSRTAEAFAERFGAKAREHFDAPLDAAREHQRAGRQDDALASYQIALERAPRDWSVLGECAEFVGLSIGDYDAGAVLARAAVELNPWYSPWLWNILGDCLYCHERIAEAHEAYLQAARINPKDTRTCLSLAYTYSAFGDCEAALDSLARALVHDAGGHYRPRLLERQQQILLQIDALGLTRQDRLARRALRLGPDRPVALAADEQSATPPAPDR